MDVKPGYRQTEVGVIPEDWEVKTIQSLANIERGKFTARPRNDPKYFGGEIPFIQTGDVTNARGWIKVYSQTLNLEGLKVSKLFPRGTLFFTIAANIGYVGFADFDTACPDSLVAITTFKGIDKYWLAHELEKRKPLFENLASQNAQLNINLEKLRPYLLPVPTPTEQEAIAEVLSDADALIESLEQLLVKKRRLKQGAMQELLTGKKRLPGFEITPGYKQTEAGVIPKDWSLTVIENLACITTGNKNTQDHIDNGCYPFFVRSHTIERINSYSYDGEAVLTAGDGVGTGKVFHYINGKFDVHQRVYRISDFKEINGYFFFLFFSSNFYNRIMKMTAKSSVDSVRREMIAGMLIPVPPTSSEQSAIATILSDMDAELDALEAKLTKARRLKQGMMQVLLTGQVRLVDQEVTA